MKIRLMLVMVVGIFFLSCGNKEKQVLYLFNWSYYIPDDVLHDFRKETGIKVVLDTYDSNESMYAKLRSGNANYDIVVPSADYMEMMREEGMLAPLDLTQVPNIGNIDENLADLLVFDPQHMHSVPYFVGAAGINVNKNKVGDLQPTWNIFADERFKGRMTMMNDMRETLGASLAYNGFSINSTNPEEIAIAKETLLNWKKNLLKFDAEMFGKDFASGAVAITHGYAEVVLTELEASDGVDYQYILPEEGGVIYVDNLVILAQSPNKENAHIFINYLLRPDIHARIADTFYYPTLIPEASALRQRAPAYEINDLIRLDYEVKRDLGSAGELYSKAWSEVFRS